MKAHGNEILTTTLEKELRDSFIVILRTRGGAPRTKRSSPATPTASPNRYIFRYTHKLCTTLSYLPSVKHITSFTLVVNFSFYIFQTQTMTLTELRSANGSVTPVTPGSQTNSVPNVLLDSSLSSSSYTPQA